MVWFGAFGLLAACDLEQSTNPDRLAPGEALHDVAMTPGGTDVYVVAHQDDWQLFMGDRTATSAQIADRTVIVYTTAGDAGWIPQYWHAREAATNASVDSMAGPAPWSCAPETVNGHSILRCTTANVVSYYMRLPDGNGDGLGYEATGFTSLAKLRDEGTPIAAIDGSTTYTSWADLVSTMRALIALESAGTALEIHAPEWDPGRNSSDHPDHIATGSLIRAAAVGSVWTVSWYVGYETFYSLPNLTAAQRAPKWETIVAYDDVMKGDWGTIIGNSHAETWSWRTFYRVETTTGTLPGLAFVDVYVGAHQDDWIFFMNPSAANSVLSGKKVVWIFTTAGDAGTATSNPAFWLAREEGSKLAADSIAGASPRSCANSSVNGHSIWRCESGSKVEYYLRLPDGNGHGLGYGSGSLTTLRDNGVPLSAVNGSTTYASWSDLSGTIQQIIDTETGNQGGPYVQVHTLETDLELNSGDHPDHIRTGELIRSASLSRSWQLFWYLGYPVEFTVANLEAAEVELKTRIFTVYDDYMYAVMGERLAGQVNINAWLRRQAFRDEPAAALAPEAPEAPTGLAPRAINGTRIDLTWVDNALSEDGYRVERAPDVDGAPGEYATIRTLPWNATAFSNTGLAVGTTYWYRVRAFNLHGSTTSAAASEMTLYPPAAPSALSATGVTSAFIDLTWTDNSVNESSFRIERAPDVGGAPGTFVNLGSVGAGLTTFRAKGMAPATTYWFRVRATNAAGISAFSEAAAGTTLAYEPPSLVSATGYLVGTTRNVDLTWTAGSELTVDLWANTTRFRSGIANGGGPVNHKPTVSMGTTVNYKVCVAGRTAEADCSVPVPVTF